MKASYLVIVLLIAIPVVSFAQTEKDSLKKMYDTQSISRFGNKFLKGKTVLTNNQLLGEFKSAQTLQLYFLSKRKAAMGRALSIGSFAVFIVSLFTKTNTLGSVGFAAGEGALSLTGFVFQTQSSLFLERALWLHNREILFEPNMLPLEK